MVFLSDSYSTLPGQLSKKLFSAQLSVSLIFVMIFRKSAAVVETKKCALFGEDTVGDVSAGYLCWCELKGWSWRAAEPKGTAATRPGESATRGAGEAPDPA